MLIARLSNREVFYLSFISSRLAYCSSFSLLHATLNTFITYLGSQRFLSYSYITYFISGYSRRFHKINVNYIIVLLLRYVVKNMIGR